MVNIKEVSTLLSRGASRKGGARKREDCAEKKENRQKPQSLF